MGPALLGRMSDSEPFGDHTEPRQCLYINAAARENHALDLQERKKNYIFARL